jgi:hypothetical protein
MADKPTSQQNKESLKKWYSDSGCQDIKFWVPPSVIKSQEESEAEVLSAVRAFGSDKNKIPANGETV